jgi:hypothetical protein
MKGLSSIYDESELYCGDTLGWQPVVTTFKNGSLVSMYFAWDRDLVKNLSLDFEDWVREEIEVFEQQRKIGPTDEMTLSKEHDLSQLMDKSDD